MATPQTYIDYARTALDSDSTELPDALMIQWFRMAEARIFEALETAIGGRTSGTITASTSTAILPVTGMNRVNRVNGPLWELIPIEHEEAMRRWPLNRIATDSGRVTGTPTHWSSDYEGNVWLWPSPAAADTFRCSGEKTYTPITTAASTIDTVFPADVLALFGDYMVAKGYVLQQNPPMAQLVMQRFEGELDIQQRRFNRVNRDRAATLGGERSRSPVHFPDRLRYPFE